MSVKKCLACFKQQSDKNFLGTGEPFMNTVNQPICAEVCDRFGPIMTFSENSMCIHANAASTTESGVCRKGQR